MAFNLPTDLIQQVQITLRSNAGLSSYDPRDPTLPSLPSVESAIAGIDPSPPYLRCKRCKGKLLRGLQSVICVYCGKRQRKDATPDQIAFNSTLAYRWLLDSLHFDGSEVVVPSSEGSKFNRRKNKIKEKISLSELLNLQITWPDEPEEPETIVPNTSLEQSESALNFSTVKWDDFFPGSERNNAINASEEQPAVSNQIAISASNAFTNPTNPNFFQEIQPSETVTQSSIHASADALTGWEADFQSADAKNQHEDSKSFEPIIISDVDLSAPVDSVFVPTDHSNDVKLTFDSSPRPTVSDWMQDDQINNVNSSVLPQAELFDSVIGDKNAVSSEDIGNKSSEIIGNDWFQDTNWQNSTVTSETINKDDDLLGETTDTLWQANSDSAKDKMVREEDDSFDDWNDFASLTINQDSSKKSCNQSGNEVNASGQPKPEMDLLMSTDNLSEVYFSGFSQSDPFSGTSSNAMGIGEPIYILPDISMTDRTTDAKVGENSEQAEKNANADVSTEAHQKDDIEMLMPQMHDLSFMLERNLSVPSKPDDIGSVLHD